MLWTVIVISCLVPYSSAKDYSLLEPTFGNNVEIDNCLEKILSKVILPDSEIFLINSQFKVPFPVVYQNLSLKYFRVFKFRKPDIYIVTLDASIATIIESLLQFQIYNPRATFIIVLETDAQNVFPQLLKYFIHDVILLERNNLTLTTFEPLKNEKIFDGNLEPKILGNCEAFDLSKRDKKVPKLWRNTTVSAVFHDFFPYLYDAKTRLRGGEFYLYQQFFEKVAFKNQTFLKIDFAGFGKRNGTYEGTLKSLYNREATILLNLYEAHENLIHDFDMVPLYMDISQYWVVPHAKPRAYWKAIIYSFKYDIWLIITSLLVSLSLIWQCLDNRSFIASFLVMYQILIEASLPSVVKIRSNLTRLFLFAVLLPFLVISTTFRTAMIQSLTSNSYEAQIDSLEDLIESKVSCNITESIQKTFASSDDNVAKYVKNCNTHKSEDVNNAIFDQIVAGRKVATISRLTQYRRALTRLYQEGFKGPIMHVIPARVSQNYMNLYLAKGTPFYHRFCEISGRFQFNGITTNLFRNIVWQSKRVISSHQLNKSNKLSIKQVAVAFYLFLIGLGAAFLVFLAEVLVKMYL
ncbi:uncharacterized protein LOC107398569 [Tribolium castaneum]|uniref:Ionotropic glutamate receptor C-terminal domain-containing protein n=1 Tax=Tribolium castaneum TaxID=7070 RepID=D6WUT3_TRICA|nr:PREDICTED: uncharacterized protein LOC107398569 [Tribolium castaneum]EFA09063.1 hypothetical protein TcasGA2_TC006778 [Tribolium castaneum]|eukprot:XP_015838489.1 PREDICTED: uncharacterized protein LOC107398569 [Tribolium castaneum]